MKNNIELINLAHKNNRKVPKKVIFILIISIFFLCIFIPFSYYRTYEQAIDKILNLDSDFRIIKIYGDENISKAKKVLEENKNIVKILDKKSGSGSTTANIFELEFNPKKFVIIKPNLTNFTPEITHGNSIKNSFEMICPMQMALGVFDDKDISSLLNMKDYLGENLKLNFYKVYNNENKIETYEHNLRLVGLYDATDYYSYSTCYIEENSYFEIVDQIINLNEIYENQGFIYVNNLKNVNEITKILVNNGIDYYISSLDTEFLDSTLNISYYLTIVIIILSFIIIMFYLKTVITSKRQNLALYKAIGFSNKEITKIVFFSILELYIYAFIISLVFCILGKYILESHLHNNITYASLNIKISIVPIFIYFLIIIIMSLFLTFTNSFKTKKFNIKELNDN